MFKIYFTKRTCFNCKRFLSFARLGKADLTKERPILMEPFEYANKVPSKYYELLAPSFNQWLQIPEQKLKAIEEAVQVLATWTILIDDVQDRSAFRYGLPSAQSVFGVGLTINAANEALILGQKLMSDLGHPIAPELFSKVFEDNFYGQGIDIYWGVNFVCPTEDMHIEMAAKKSGSWFALQVKLMQLFSKNKTDYSELGNWIGTYYVFVDDYFNLFKPKALKTLGSKKQDNHQSCSDITECKITLAVIHALQFPDVADELTDIYKQRTSDPELHKRAISLLKKHKSDEYVKDTLKVMEADIRTKIEQLGGNARLSAYMDDLSIY